MRTLFQPPKTQTGDYQATVPSPTRDTEFSIRAAHQFGDRHSAYLQYSYEDWSGQNQGVGGQSLASNGFNSEYREDDLTAHVDTTLSAVLLNQLSMVFEHDFNRHSNVVEDSRVSVRGFFNGGSAQNDSFATENNFRVSDMVTWTHGQHLVTFGIGIPHWPAAPMTTTPTPWEHTCLVPRSRPTVPCNSRRSTTTRTTCHRPFRRTGRRGFMYYQQEIGAFIQDQFKLNSRFSVTPGIRYDWEDFLADRRLGFAPRISFAWVLDEQSKTVVRGGGGIYYDRFGSGPLLDLVRYEDARRCSVQFSLDPAALPETGCVPVTNCTVITEQPPNRAGWLPMPRFPTRSSMVLHRTASWPACHRRRQHQPTRGIQTFARRCESPTPACGYTTRPDQDHGLVRQMQSASFFEGSGWTSPIEAA